MQDPSTQVAFSQLKAQQQQQQFPEQEQLKCPRCDSDNTKFCYYNNYNLSQPRHFCKSCRRYWTKGGALRNIPVGGGSRKNTKRTSSKRSSTSALVSGQVSGLESKPVSIIAPQIETGLDLPVAPGREGVGAGSFTSLLGLASEGHFSNYLLEGLGPNGMRLGQGGDGHIQSPNPGIMGCSTSEGLIMGGFQNGGDHHHHHQTWLGTSNGWPDLAIYTDPGSKFQ